jgi:thiosulfate/3-mercaptopyruvate sulfurtransferase
MRGSASSDQSSAETTAAQADHLLSGRMYVSIDDAIKAYRDFPNDVAFVDGSWWLGRSVGPREQFVMGPRICESQFFDVDDVCSKGPELNPKNLPHMMPAPRLFGTAMDFMGITNQRHVILYGQEGCPFLHRSWYTFRSMGHDPLKLHLLDGSVAEWKRAGGPVDDDGVMRPLLVASDLDVTVEPAYRARKPQQIVDMQEIKRVVEDPGNAARDDVLIVDARSSDRFYARVDEPRPGLRRGHMPGAKNLFFMDLLDANDPVRLKPKDELEAIIAKAGIDLADASQKIYASCGSGATACAVAAALVASGKDPGLVYVYDGSWMEWGADPDVPIVTTD